MDSEISQDAIAENQAKEVFGSMKQAAAIKQLSVSLLKAAKASGCPGFDKSGRVYWEQVQPWLTEHADELKANQEESKDYWVLFKLRADAQRSQLALERDKGLYLSKEEVAQQLLQLGSATKAIFKTKLEDELPPQLVGLDSISIKEKLSKAVDEICAIFQRPFEQWGNQC